MRRLILLCLGSLLSFTSLSSGHYSMLLPESWSGKKDQPITFTYQWGHPFEHQLFDAPAPELVVILAPDGKVSDQTKGLEKIAVPSGDMKVTAYRFKFTPNQRGDYVVVLRTPPIWMKDENEFWQDTVKVVLHVQAQKGWDHKHKEDFEWSPLTRPYGLEAGMVFQAKILQEMKTTSESKPAHVPLSGALVEVELYNKEPPTPLPPDEQITRTAKTDPNGVVTCTLTQGGWWCLTTGREVGVKEHEGKNFPVRQRSTFWVYVSPKDPGR
jgi:cobalt/nickel transport protein